MSSIIGGSITMGGPAVPAVPVPVRTYAQTFGDGTTLVFPITHNLGTLDTQTQVYNPITGLQVAPTAYTAVHTSPNVTTLTFTTAPAAGAARVVIEA
jgi:hypothetical protein